MLYMRRILFGLACSLTLGACDIGITVDPTSFNDTDEVDPSETGGEDGSGNVPAAPPSSDKDATVDEGEDIKETPPGCGDGVLEQDDDSQTCDDGNLTAGDGCDPYCQTESGFLCPNQGGACSPNCGDGMRLGSEKCDDGNSQAGDGCGQDCALEAGWACPTAGQACRAARCGDGVVAGDESCDDNNETPGDGCDMSCETEAGWVCVGASCAAAGCGDGIRAGAEQCDDGDMEGADGCSELCELEPGWICPTQGTACEAERCGDGILAGDETCDDDNSVPGDGCSNYCQQEAGWLCDGGTCVAAECGDGIRAGLEACDDGNEVGDDGCAGDCMAKEPFYRCPVTGGTCTKLTTCGDGRFTADEECDDGNSVGGDGCSSACTIEAGFSCTGGSSCTTECGDGIKAGTEQCDDGDGDSGDGCTDECRLEVGFQCPTAGAACIVAICGNGIAEGLEQCDDGALVNGQAVPNNQLGDGCTPTCTREPQCQDGVCQATCGDGIVDTGEACDDRNNQNYDGCSAECEIEEGFVCTNVTEAPPECVDLDLVLRDFKDNNVTGGHPDFGNNNGDTGLHIVQDYLGFDLNNDGVADSSAPTYGAPSLVFNPSYGGATVQSATTFNAWYHDSAWGKTVISTMKVCDDPNDNKEGVYIFDDLTFYPLDGLGWQDPSLAQQELSSQDGSLNGCGIVNTGDPDAGQPHNFLFTSEVRFWFTYKGTEVLSFTGDDDVWVFINGYKAVDLSGVHCAVSGAVTLSTIATQAGLQVGKTYEAVVYQAERMPVMSTYHLELGNFISELSHCDYTCGDGIRTPYELCDDGSVCDGGTDDGESCVSDGDCGGGGTCRSLNDGSYGHCLPDCQGRGSYCGDGVLDPQEQCDNGDLGNDSSYDGCNADCTYGPTCGDGVVDAFFGEQCDDGTGNADNVYGACSTSCRLGARCGDGEIQSEGGEVCDDGVDNRNGVYGACTTACDLGPHCGDGVVQAGGGEQCDAGDNASDGYGGCSESCELGARCGDGIVQSDAGEQCDDGVNSGAYKTCSPGCMLAPRCGDGVVQPAEGEECDDGDDNTGDYGGCSATCKRAAYCGNGVIDGPEGKESCDDGNLNSFDGCSKECAQEWVLE